MMSRFSRVILQSQRLACAATSAAGGSHLGSDDNPYEVLGISSIAGFDKIKMAYSKKRKEAERRGDEEALAQLERAYDRVMMSQLSNRKKGLTFGSFQVSKDIKYADKEPIVPWGPRFSRSSVKDIRINLAISAVFTIWIWIQQHADWKPLQFVAFAFVYRIFEKLKASEPASSSVVTEDGEVYEDEGRMVRMGKRLFRSLGLVFGCIAVASLGFTGILNLIEFSGQYIPLFIFNHQELIVTTATSVLLYFLASYYR